MEIKRKGEGEDNLQQGGEFTTAHSPSNHQKLHFVAFSCFQVSMSYFFLKKQGPTQCSLDKKDQINKNCCFNHFRFNS